MLVLSENRSSDRHVRTRILFLKRISDRYTSAAFVLLGLVFLVFPLVATVTFLLFGLLDSPPSGTTEHEVWTHLRLLFHGLIEVDFSISLYAAMFIVPAFVFLVFANGVLFFALLLPFLAVKNKGIDEAAPTNRALYNQAFWNFAVGAAGYTVWWGIMSWFGPVDAIARGLDVLGRVVGPELLITEHIEFIPALSILYGVGAVFSFGSLAWLYVSQRFAHVYRCAHCETEMYPSIDRCLVCDTLWFAAVCDDCGSTNWREGDPRDQVGEAFDCENCGTENSLSTIPPSIIQFFENRSESTSDGGLSDENFGFQEGNVR